jgi:hypothetical protein
LDIYSPEVQSCFDNMVAATVKANNYRFSQYEVERQLDKEKTKIANTLSTQKKAMVRDQLRTFLPSESIIDAFMSGNIEPAVEAKVNEQMKKQFPDIPVRDLASAINKNSTVIQSIAIRESHKVLNKQSQSYNLLEQSFDQIHLGKNKEPVDLEGKCLWVPASVRHEVKKDDLTGLARYSFFVYGGVNIQPRTNIVADRGPLSGRAVGSRAFKDIPSRSLDNRATREWYHNQLDKIPALINQNLPLRERALQAVKLRNDIKIQARELMADQKLAKTLDPLLSLKVLTKNAYDKNKVGDKIWESMLGSSRRTNQSVDDHVGVQNKNNKSRSSL